MGWIKKNSKTQEGKGQIRKIQEKQEGKNGGKKRRDFVYTKVPILMCSPSVENALEIPPLCNPPLGKPTHMGTSPTT
jgi:hypothetical protein